MRILVIEDSEAISSFLMRIFELEGWSGETTMSFSEGLRLAQQAMARDDDFDAVLLDLSLPDQTPRWFLDNLHATTGINRPAVLIFTAGPHAQAEAASLGADGYIQKPFALETFFLEISRAVQSLRDLRGAAPRARLHSVAAPAQAP